MRWVIFSMGLLVMVCGTRAEATVTVALSKADLFAGAESVVSGEVIEVAFERGPRQGPEIMTRITIAVSRTHKAGPGGITERLVLRQTGGRLNGKILTVHGQAEFAEGERVLVFVERLSDGRRMPYGMAQGKFSLVDEGTRRVARRDLNSLAVVSGGGARVVGADALPLRFDWTELERWMSQQQGAHLHAR